MSDIKVYLEKKKEDIDHVLNRLLPGEDVYPSVIHQSMRYSVFSGGKRFRPALAMAVNESCGGQMEDVLASAAALEMIHTYSLIHDDLPAMDNDDYRRGKLSNHKKFGEDIAILSGDALISLAFEVMHPKVVADVAKAIGSLGVVGGQVVDIMLAKNKISLDLPLLEYIHQHKTGQLIAVSCRVGAVLAGSSATCVEAMTRYGQHIGLAFQMVDDIFDQENYAVLVGEQLTREHALRCVALAKKELSVLPEGRRSILEDLADYVVSRQG